MGGHTLTAAQTDFDPPETLPVSQAEMIEQPAETTSANLLERYWRLVPPRRRNGPCTEKSTYKLVERDITINRTTGQIDRGPERNANPPQVKECMQVIPGCFPQRRPWDKYCETVLGAFPREKASLNPSLKSHYRRVFRVALLCRP